MHVEGRDISLDTFTERVAQLHVSPYDGLDAHDQALGRASRILDDLRDYICAINPGTDARREVWAGELDK